MRPEVEAAVLPCPSFPFLPLQSKDTGSLANGPLFPKIWKTSEGAAWIGCSRWIHIDQRETRHRTKVSWLSWTCSQQKVPDISQDDLWVPPFHPIPSPRVALDSQPRQMGTAAVSLHHSPQLLLAAKTPRYR